MLLQVRKNVAWGKIKGSVAASLAVHESYLLITIKRLKLGTVPEITFLSMCGKNIGCVRLGAALRTLIARVAHSANLSKNLLPLDILDDVQDEIDQLRAMVLDLLNESSENLDSILTNASSFGDDIYKEQSTQVDARLDDAHNILVGVQQWADANGLNISSCAATLNTTIEFLSSETILLTADCADIGFAKILTVVETSYYNTDVLLTKVEQFEFQVTTCKGDEDCLISLVTQIYHAKTDIPQQITEEVNKAQDDVKALEKDMQICAQTLYDDYDQHMASMVISFEECAEAVDAKLI